jgi:putative sugar O-methyltransferase
MYDQGFSPLFEQSRSIKKLDYSDFRADPAFHFAVPVRDQIHSPDADALKIAAEQDVDLFLRYLRVSKPNTGYKSLSYHPLDKVDCRHLMMSTVIFKHLKDINTVVEIGGGFGNWARLNLQVHPNITEWTIIDLEFVLDLQQWYLRNTLDKNTASKVYYVPAETLLPIFGADLVIGAHSLSEVSMEYFLKYLNIVDRSKYFFYARHRDYPSTELSKIKFELLMSKYKVIENVKTENDEVDNILFKCK